MKNSLHCHCYIPVISCDDNPCQNRGSCANDQTAGFSCDCTSDFKGKICDQSGKSTWTISKRNHRNICIIFVVFLSVYMCIFVSSYVTGPCIPSGEFFSFFLASREFCWDTRTRISNSHTVLSYWMRADLELEYCLWVLICKVDLLNCICSGCVGGLVLVWFLTPCNGFKLIHLCKNYNLYFLSIDQHKSMNSCGVTVYYKFH